MICFFCLFVPTYKYGFINTNTGFTNMGLSKPKYVYYVCRNPGFKYEIRVSNSSRNPGFGETQIRVLLIAYLGLYVCIWVCNYLGFKHKIPPTDAPAPPEATVWFYT